MDDKFHINPFDRSALTDYRMLAGRSQEFRQVRFILRNSDKSKNRIKSILISGERGVGKTSILNLIEAECEINNIIPVRIDLTETNSSNSCDFFWHLFSQTINKLFKLGFLEGKGGAIDAMIQKILNTDGIADQANWVFNTPILRRNYLKNIDADFEFHLFIEDLKLMRKQLGEDVKGKFNDFTKILFLIDESQHIYSNKKIIEEIRFVLQNQDLGVGFIIAGDKSYKTSHWEQVFGGSYRDFEIINLSYFDDSDSVVDYFKKSLRAINWTDEEIEETLFYKFKLTCRQIYDLTSGKPAWINTIASKMFERCMAGEIRQLRFDKQAQNNVKKLLQDSEELDKTKLEYIENLSPVYEKWVAEIFACELYSLRQVYFFSKFKFSGDNFLNIESYENLCKSLVDRKIVTLIEENEDDETKIGFNKKKIIDFLDHRYYAFDFRSDTIKQWLQISSNGLYGFGYEAPSNRFMQFINEELVIEKSNTVIVSHQALTDDDKFRLTKVIEKINNNQFNVNDETYEFISILFKACKRLADSRFKYILYVNLRNMISGKSQDWNIYNFNDKGKIIDFRDSPSKINKIKSIVQSFNTSESKFEIELIIDKISELNFDALQNLIISSGDIKKIGIILKDKMEALIRFYIRESNVESSYEIAQFFYKLFEEGYDLMLKDLNNTAYVFIEKNELDKAIPLLTEAKRKVLIKNITKEDQSSALLIFYNLALVETMIEEYENSLRGFKQLIDYCEENDISDDIAGALKILKLDEKGKIFIEEVKMGDKNYSELHCKELATENIKILRHVI